jgi:transcriptional regulator with XRE-family HTH domain
MYERMKQLREDKDLTQKQIAEHLNCSQRIYSNYERGDVDIPTSILIKLANFYNTSTDYILNRTNKIEPYPKSNTKSI